MKDSMNNPSGQALVAPSDIAVMAGVSRGAVSNWRKRSEDFPQPVAGGPTKPLFNRAEIEAWLKAAGKEVRTDYGLHIWAAVNALRGFIDIAEIPSLVLSIACARKLCAETGNSHAWSEIVDEVKQTGFDGLAAAGARYGIEDWDALVPVSSEMRNLSRAIAPALLVGFAEVPVDRLSEITDFALARVAGAYGKVGAEHGFVGSRVSELLVNLASPEARGVVYDPACGIGEVLLRLAGAGGDQIERLVGHDLNYEATEILEQRAYLAGVPIDVVHTDVLRHDVEEGLKADLIVCEPPFGAFWDPQIADPRWCFGVPPKSSSELAWIQHTVAHLSQGGIGYVVTSPMALSRGGEAEIRTKLLAAGCVEAIVGLPPKMLPHTSIPLALWVLRAPGAVTGRVRIVDGSQAELPETHAADWLRSLDPSSLPAPTVEIPVADLLAEGSTLLPSKWTTPPANPSETAVRYREALDGLNEILDAVADADRPVRAFTQGRGARVVTVGDLIKQGALEMRQGRPSKEGDNDVPAVSARDIRAQRLPQPDGSLGAPGPFDTATGDVLVTTMNEVRTLVDPTGGHRLGNGVYRLRILSEQLSPDYIAAVLPGEWNARHMTGSTIQRANLRDLEIPVLPRERQDALSAALSEITRLRARAAQLEAQAAELSSLLLDAIRVDADLGSEGMA
ncbi:N-6 DNA methylase [Nocardioides sp. cx-169]|uniref:N-6 DNA methylase n=1 Tax=Nocardioides sp. cx-169 TaxID=2899080 RepID=UPI001E2E08D2|nr:N-6 DNA methylase [Nocardioides sp. cx-169]MCD4532502.1 N-6 DNA methylase [Nocardioides sp. cx-169]